MQNVSGSCAASKCPAAAVSKVNYFPPAACFTVLPKHVQLTSFPSSVVIHLMHSTPVVQSGYVLFAKVKQRFKALRLQKLAGLRQDSHEALVAKAVRQVNKKDIVNCVRHVNDLLK